MKKEFLVFVIGVLIGAIIATGVFLVLQINDDNTSMNPPSGEMPENMGDMEFDTNMIGREMPGNMDSSNSSNSIEE